MNQEMENYGLNDTACAGDPVLGVLDPGSGVLDSTNGTCGNRSGVSPPQRQRGEREMSSDHHHH